MCFVNHNSSESDIQAQYRCAAVHYTRIYFVGESLYLILGSPLHIYFIWLVVMQQATASKLYAVIVALCELIFSLATVVGNAAYLATRNHCLLYVVLPSYALIFSARPLFQSLICVQRYLAVVHPIVYLRCKTLSHKLTCASLAGLIVVGFTVAEAVKTPKFIIREFAALFVILLTVDVFCSLSVLWALKRPSPGESQGQRNRMTSMKRSAFKTITVILAITFCDHIIVTIMGLSGDFAEDDWICVVDMFNTFLFCLCGFVHPLMYLHKMNKLPCAKGKHDGSESYEFS